MYSVGYEGTTVDALVEGLVRIGVSLVVDVRMTPMSRRPGFTQRPLAAALAMAGIDYIHEPMFGNPVENRDAYRRGDPAAVKVMRRRLEGRGEAAVGRLVEEARLRRVALLCVEREAGRCHRQVITDLARELAYGLEVEELTLSDA